MPRATQVFISLAIFPVALVGCSSEPSRHAISGTVTIDGAPAPYVVVKFHPTWSSSLAGGSGPTDQAGKFTIGGDGKNTGFPSGEYKVTFSQALVNGRPTLAGGGGKKSVEETVPGEREAVADDYRDTQKTPITATIGDGANNFTVTVHSRGTARHGPDGSRQLWASKGTPRHPIAPGSHCRVQPTGIGSPLQGGTCARDGVESSQSPRSCSEASRHA